MARTKVDRELETIAIFVHGILVGLHTIGIVYNIRRRNYSDVTLHTVAVCYDAYCTYKHVRDLEAA